MAEGAAITEAIQANQQDAGLKVFVGNLAFTTKESDLHDIFGKVGQISEAQIITRGSRSLGYGFVTFGSEADATSAIQTLDKNEFSGRQIHVALAKPLTSAPGGSIAKEAAEAAAGGEPSRRGRGAATRVRGGARKPRADAETEEAGDAPVAASADEPSAGALVNSGEGGARGGRRGGGRGRGGRSDAPRRRGPPTGEPSKTQLFITNLPFSATDETLKEVFAKYKVASVKVVTRKYGAFQGRSKGFGFVDLESESEQQKALQELSGQEIEGRKMEIKVALAEDRTSAEGEEAEEPEAQIVAS